MTPIITITYVVDGKKQTTERIIYDIAPDTNIQEYARQYALENFGASASYKVKVH